MDAGFKQKEASQMTTEAEKRAAHKYAKSKKGKSTKRIWKDCNREKVKRWKREWSASPNGKLREKKYWRKSPRGLFHVYSQVAAKRGREFSISFEQFNDLIFKPCIYCGYVPSPPDRNGLDRVDNTMGYKINNVVPYCHPCNQIKGKKTVQEMIARCKAIITHMEEKQCL
jgi:hypothetical protein